MHTRQVAPTPALVKQVGLPLYPNATPVVAQDVDQSFGSRGTHGIGVLYQTKDDAVTVERFYAAHLPKSAKRMELSIGIAKAVSFMYFDHNDQKQVTLTIMKDVTLIQLRRMTFNFTSPAPQPS